MTDGSIIEVKNPLQIEDDIEVVGYELDDVWPNTRDEEIDDLTINDIGDQGAETKAAAMEKNSTRTDTYNTSSKVQTMKSKLRTTSNLCNGYQGAERKAAPEKNSTVTQVNAVGCEKAKLSTKAIIDFVVTDVRHPLASATKVTEAGNRIVMEEGNSFIENIQTGEKIELVKSDGVFKMNVVFDNGETGYITLDSGAAVNVWPKELQTQVQMTAPSGQRLRAANGTAIANYGNKAIGFRAKKADDSYSVVGKKAGFTRRV